MEILEAGGLRLAVTDEGSGTPILALHPFPLDGSVLERPAAALSRERRVIRVDYPGFGHSPPPAGTVTIEAYAQALREVLARKRITRADGLGLSIGSYTLVELARQAPMLFTRLVLVSSRTTANTQASRADREAMAMRAEVEGVGWIAGVWTPLLLRPDPELATKRIVEKIICRATPQGVASGARALAARADQSAAAKALGARTLVVHGSEDQLTPVAEAENLAQLVPHSKLELIPGAGHLPHLDEPDRFERVVLSFLSD